MSIADTLSRESLHRVDQFIHLLDRWRTVTDLISNRGFHHIWTRHIEDSIALQRSCSSKRRWLDIGSGAGFPGIIIGILLVDCDKAQVHCVESDGRKCAFLRAAVRELEVPVRIHNIRAEALNRAKIDEIEVVTARAFSSMANILRLSSLFLAKGAVAVLPRSESSIAEVEELDSTRYMVHIDAKRSDARGVIIRIQERRRGT